MKRIGSTTAVALLVLLAAGCSPSQTPSPPGILAQTVGGVQGPIPADAIPPPANLMPEQASAPAAPPTGGMPYDGAYRGIGIATSNPNGMCDTQLTITNFKVSQGKVSFGEFHGTIRPQGDVEMAFRNTWVTGQFYPGRFDGQFYEAFPGCTYRMQMTRQ